MVVGLTDRPGILGRVRYTGVPEHDALKRMFYTGQSLANIDIRVIHMIQVFPGRSLCFLGHQFAIPSLQKRPYSTNNGDRVTGDRNSVGWLVPLLRNMDYNYPSGVHTSRLGGSWRVTKADGGWVRVLRCVVN